MRKPLVAIKQIDCDEPGRRKYVAINKDGEVLHTITVNDCGHGAHLAFKQFEQQYNISYAEWTYTVEPKL